ncbi:FAD-dependent oxidoreductase [Acinetobacter sp. ANC 3813]|uniref:FAD-dependent oxidoreductase n=1 Tax=Acinetobacter sp. ANC 3813 TaxID=1977873 RepID=UPI000A3319D0|nr:FAD-dependent oxidoreductase [Acinetobacter sp. ANC 3813]OTG90835.1 3-oxosteroid 1-dehydrogenase [Acinetobacter sp. ANC 3813]
MEKNFDFDVVVVGSGASGMSTAITAKLLGLNVAVIEKSKNYGGTTARSGGWLWVPCTQLGKNYGHDDSPEAVKAYLKHEGGAAYNEARVDSFVNHCYDAVDFFTKNTAVQFDMPLTFPDYHAEAPGAMQGGRSMVTRPFDARELGDRLALLEPPLPELTVFGMMIGSGADLRHFMKATRSLESAIYTFKRFSTHFAECMKYGRGMLLTNGNALAGRLAKTALDLNIPVLVDTAAKELILKDGKVAGVIAQSAGQEIILNASKAVVLAAGGFPHNIELRKRLYGHTPTGLEHWSPTTETNTGDSIAMAEKLNVAVDTYLPNAAAWAPVSLVKRKDGTTGVMPHFIDRAKPGVIAVNKKGKRFVNEANSYHDFVQGMINGANIDGQITSWLICDRKTLRMYGLGSVPPQPLPIGKHLKSGYLKKGNSIAELAKNCGIDAKGLEETIQKFNPLAKIGQDPDFGKGSKAYNRYQGDPLHMPNPCLKPIEQGPFYAVQLHPGDIGTYAGLPVDRHSRVLDQSGKAVAGLYSVGNDATSIMGGNYPGAGITLGPALVFGYQTGLFIAKGQDNNPAVETIKRSAEAV